ncbi:cct domain containing protein [Nannochloropsis oceanica]
MFSSGATPAAACSRDTMTMTETTSKMEPSVPSSPCARSVTFPECNSPQHRHGDEDMARRMRQVDDLEQRGLLDTYQGYVLKDMISHQEHAEDDAILNEAWAKHDAGDVTALVALANEGIMQETPSMDLLLEDLDLCDFDFSKVNVEEAVLGTTRTASPPPPNPMTTSSEMPETPQNEVLDDSLPLHPPCPSADSSTATSVAPLMQMPPQTTSMSSQQQILQQQQHQLQLLQQQLMQQQQQSAASSSSSSSLLPPPSLLQQQQFAKVLHQLQPQHQPQMTLLPTGTTGATVYPPMMAAWGQQLLSTAPPQQIMWTAGTSGLSLAPIQAYPTNPLLAGQSRQQGSTSTSGPATSSSGSGSSSRSDTSAPLSQEALQQYYLTLLTTNASVGSSNCSSSSSSNNNNNYTKINNNSHSSNNSHTRNSSSSNSSSINTSSTPVPTLSTLTIPTAITIAAAASAAASSVGLVPGTRTHQHYMAKLIEAAVAAQPWNARPPSSTKITTSSCPSSASSSAPSSSTTTTAAIATIPTPAALSSSAVAAAANRMSTASSFPPKLSVATSKDEGEGHTHQLHQRYVGVYSPRSRRGRIARYLDKRTKRNWDMKKRKNKGVYMGRRDLDTMVRVRGRFTKKVTAVVTEAERKEMKNVGSLAGTTDIEEGRTEEEREREEEVKEEVRDFMDTFFDLTSVDSEKEFASIFSSQPVGEMTGPTGAGGIGMSFDISF